MGLLDWFKLGRKKKPEESPSVEEEAPSNIEGSAKEKPKRAKRKRKNV